MYIECICIEDGARPTEIPVDKWPKKGDKYHITWIYKQVAQPGIQGCTLKEFNIEDCYPYNCYRLNRFAINVNDLQKLATLIETCTELSGVDIMRELEQLETVVI